MRERAEQQGKMLSIQTHGKIQAKTVLDRLQERNQNLDSTEAQGQIEVQIKDFRCC